jgi:hypothetical protein
MVFAATMALLAGAPLTTDSGTASLEAFPVTALYEALIAEPQTGFVCRNAPAVALEVRRLQSSIEARTKAAAVKIRKLGTAQHFDEIDARSKAGEYIAIVSPSSLVPCGSVGDAEELRRWHNLLVILQEFERRAGVGK